MDVFFFLFFFFFFWSIKSLLSPNSKSWHILCVCVCVYGRENATHWHWRILLHNFDLLLKFVYSLMDLQTHEHTKVDENIKVWKIFFVIVSVGGWVCVCVWTDFIISFYVFYLIWLRCTQVSGYRTKKKKHKNLNTKKIRLHRWKYGKVAQNCHE